MSHANNKKRSTRIFFDMDGVLNVWELGTHIDVVSEPGYMRFRDPIRPMLSASRLLAEAGYEVWVASAVLPYEHTIPDKKYWIRENCPWFTEDHQIFIPYGTNKAKYLLDYVEAGDVFLDDYTQNLIDLSSAFRDKLECIKVLNGINDTRHSWNGKRISIYSDAESIAESIDAISLLKRQKRHRTPRDYVGSRLDGGKASG